MIAYSTEDYVQLKVNQSPFNVGLPFQLPEFTLLQMRELAVRHGLNWETEPGKERTEGKDYSLRALHSLVGGHPYLVRLAMYAVAQGDRSVERLLDEALTDAGVYHRHLLRHWNVLTQTPDLAAAMKQVASASEPVMLDQGQKFKLHSMGLIEFQGNEVVPRCQLYRDYFQRAL
ncbi:AAA-like domain-containing protein [Leptolyngbya sp. FACHB-711]|uniref:AAA-like domain-containing protein n=1 Tax=Leptolyngbya sp. FACHB-711 TaxID=2692813 RepID=UPI0016863D20|nr:AAA-like domain-containing protein [Leptolyngbya sp. FACHB-711]